MRRSAAVLRHSTRIAPGLDDSRVSLPNHAIRRSSPAREGAKSPMFAAPPQPASDSSISRSRSSSPRSRSASCAATVVDASAAYRTSACARSGWRAAKRIATGPPQPYA